MDKDQVMREYFAAQGRKGGSVKGKCKARKLSREHYAKTGQAVRSYWENWRKVNGRTKGKRERERQANGSVAPIRVV